VAEGNPLLNDSELAKRLWQVSMQIVARITSVTRTGTGSGVIRREAIEQRPWGISLAEGGVLF
jgi:hypothetical protein